MQHELLKHPIDVYNFTVENNHNYFVGNSSILVHNMCDKAILKGIEIGAIILAAAAWGMTCSQVLSGLDAGTLTWPDIFNPPRDDVDDKADEITTTWPQRDKPPKDDEPVYQFAYIKKFAKTIQTNGPKFNLIEMKCIILLAFEGDGAIVDDIFNLSSEMQKMIHKLADTFIKSINESVSKQIPFGIYTDKKNDMLTLKNNICAPLYAGEHHTQGHPGKGDMVQYKHFHCSNEPYEIDEYGEKKLTDGAYNIHLWYGNFIGAEEIKK